jgi:hypothetical protein
LRVGLIVRDETGERERGHDGRKQETRRSAANHLRFLKSRRLSPPRRQM